MVKLGVHEWSHGKWGTNWIVTLPCAHDRHDAAIISWCEKEFGYVDMGVIRTFHSQDFWFKTESEALQCWLTWAP